MMIVHQPVYPTQQVFRILLDAVSHPGRRYRMAENESGEIWENAYLAVAHTLIDHEVSFHAVEKNGRSTMAKNIYALTKSEPVVLEKADYIFIDGPCSDGNILSAKRGSPIYPDEGATVIYVLKESTVHGESRSIDISLQGPGIEQSIRLNSATLPRKEFEALQALNSEYPMGVDCFILGPNLEVTALPRSTKIRIL